MGGSGLRSLVPFAFLVLFLCLSVNSAAAQSHAGMIEKYGPVPEAILEPGEVGDQAESLYSIYLRILERLGLANVSRHARHKACHANQRVIMGAIEMYNMDVANDVKRIDGKPLPPLRSMEQIDINSRDNLLLHFRYLKSLPVTADKSCRIRSYGDLTTDGVLYCELHGATPQIRQELCTLSGYTTAATREFRNSLFIIAGVIIGTVLVLLLFKRLYKTGSSPS